jgi:translocator assembly and maintenance protein 41
MVDYIFGVTHPHHWHSLNIQQNPHHYSMMRRFGSNATTLLQDKVGAGVYFNPYVEVDGMVRKTHAYFLTVHEEMILTCTMVSGD